jgi:hypothetical protein
VAFVAAATGLGGRPGLVPRTITPDIKHPTTGMRSTVFELPDRK